MSALNIATWNINSIRMRHPLVAKWANDAHPDVICLQEIKCLPDQFPRRV
jgi:exodeoxyribonuclease-3